MAEKTQYQKAVDYVRSKKNDPGVRLDKLVSEASMMFTLSALESDALMKMFVPLKNKA